MSIDLHFTEEDWARVERDWTAWWAGELDRPMVMIDGSLPPSLGLTVWEAVYNFPPIQSCFPLETPTDDILDHYQTILEARRFYGDAFPQWFPFIGSGIVAAFLGAQVHCALGDTVWFGPASCEQGSIKALRIAYDANNFWWQWAQELTRAAVERWGDRVCVGYTDLGGNLDILASLRTTQQLLLDLYDAPDQVDRLVRQVNRLWIRYYDELDAIIRVTGRGTSALWAPFWAPGRSYMLQSDFSYMISPPMFERFVLPDLASCCEVMDYPFYHLDGKGAIPHLDMLLSLERLRGINWIPGAGAPPPEEWLPLLKRIRDAGKLCQVYVSPEGARTIVRELGGRGFALAILQGMSRNEVQGFLRTLAAEDAMRWACP